MDRRKFPMLPEMQSSEGRMFALSEQMNQLLLQALNPALWRVQPPGKVRTIAAIFTHIHNVRCKWVRLTAPGLIVPTKLDRYHCSPAQARVGLAESAIRCTEMLEQSIGNRVGEIQTFRRDGWAPGWPVGVEMLTYMVSHEAHHRGQICLLAHQLGYPLSGEVTSHLWNWECLLRGPG